MLKITIPASAFNFQGTKLIPIKFQFSYANTKKWLSEQFQIHDMKVEVEKIKKPKISQFQNFPQSFINTAHSLLHLFFAEYQKGKTEAMTMRLTYSYIKKSLVGAKLTVRTLQRHLDRLLNSLSFPLIKQKFRSTLGERPLADSDNTNCIAIEFSPLAMKCVTDSQNMKLENGEFFEKVPALGENKQILFGENGTEVIRKINERTSEGSFADFCKKSIENQMCGWQNLEKSPIWKGDNDILSDKYSD